MKSGDSAKICFYNLLADGYKEAAYKGLLSVYKKEHTPDSIEKYSILFANANDTSYLGSQHERIAQMTAMYDYGVQKKKAETAQQRIIKSNKTISIMSITLLALIILLFILYLYFYIKKKNVSQKINSLQTDIKHYTLIISNLQNKNNDKVDTLKALLEESKNELAKYKQSQTLSAFFDSEIYCTFKKASRNGSYIISKDEWDDLEILFNNTFSSYSDFIHSGRSMSSQQQYVCMLIRMGFGETEMANILDVDSKRVSRIKSQINQKLFNSQSAKTLLLNLKEYF